ncbi:DUF2125 domain containing protein [Sulfitobacter noctilucae]|uniref:DUF2125 domain-containing protein n=1 Tax=Sulfitobacter noctilucae TaxID=1342302 RepID=UPI00046A8564|nr:DUF2125 domain-containing protein [Sulfitobacter noctilucae]KIN70755.1 DUF2125 domain containing protein [Sulfitobacter noctilucae]
MSRLVKIIVVLALLWCGWWFAAATALERGVVRWLEDRRTEGWEAQAAAVDVTGFPLALQTDLTAVSLTDSATGLHVDAPDLRVSMPAYWPGDMTLVLSGAPIDFGVGDTTYILRAQDTAADLNLHPGTALELERLTAQSGPWQVNTRQGNLLSADDFTANVTQDKDDHTVYEFALNAADFSPGGLLRAGLDLPDDWSLTFETFTANITARFDRPIDRMALESRRPQPRQITVNDFDFSWGEFRIALVGDVQIDTEGTPDGDLMLSIKNWRQALELLKKTEIIRSEETGQAEFVIQAIASNSDNPADLDLAFSFREGRLFLGPINLGPAPKFILR